MRKKHHPKPEEVEEKILETEEKILHTLRKIEHNQPHQPITKVLVVQFGKSRRKKMASITLNVGDQVPASVFPSADGSTNDGGTLSNIVWSFTDPSASFINNPDGSVTFTAVAPSSDPVNGASGTVTASVTDTNGAVSTQSGSFTIIVAGTVTPPQPITTSLQVQFGTVIPAGSAPTGTAPVAAPAAVPGPGEPGHIKPVGPGSILR